MHATTHPTSDLSAYVDGALRPDEGARVQAHLDTCAPCRRQVADLRATAALLARLPDPVPTRRLMPRLSTVPVWLAPLRTLSAVASGACVMVLVASVLLGNMSQLRASGTAALQASGGAGAAQAPAAPAPAATAAPERANADSVKQPTASAGASASASSLFSAPSPTPVPPQDAVAAKQREARDAQQRSQPEVPFSPWLWLAGAIATAALAIALQRRLTAG